MNRTGTLQVALTLRTYSEQVERHDHDHHQIVLPQSGAMDIEIDGRGGRVDWSQGVIIPAGTAHAFCASSTNRFLVLDLPLASAGTDQSETESIKRLQQPGFFAVRPPIRHLLDYATHSEPLLVRSSEMAQSWSNLLISSLVQPYGRAHDHGSLTLARALTHIENNLDTPLTAAQIARASGISERRLYTLFEQQLKTTPFTHVTRLRLDLAMDLLRDTRLSIADIAQRAGYADQSALNHALKKNRNLTPAAVRRSASTS